MSPIVLPLALLLTASSFAQLPEEQTTTVVPLADEDIPSPCEYRLALPDSPEPVRAAWIIFDRGQDYLRWYLDRQVRGFARDHHLALILAAHCRSREREDMNVEPARGLGRALFTALDQFAVSVNRPELRTAPILVMGWSGAGSLVGRLAGYRPERFYAGIAYAPGQYEPLGMDTIALSLEAIRRPQLIIANGADNINGTERPYAYFRKYFDQGAPWTFLVQNGTPHCCLQNVQTLILDWVHAVLTVPLASGKHGYIKVEVSGVTDEWKRPVFHAVSARVTSHSVKPSKRELPAGWLPTSTFADGWLAFVQRPHPVAIWKP